MSPKLKTWLWGYLFGFLVGSLGYPLIREVFQQVAA
jgi:hypothetical protein